MCRRYIKQQWRVIMDLFSETLLFWYWVTCLNCDCFYWLFPSQMYAVYFPRFESLTAGSRPVFSFNLHVSALLFLRCCCFRKLGGHVVNVPGEIMLAWWRVAAAWYSDWMTRMVYSVWHYLCFLKGKIWFLPNQSLVSILPAKICWF